MNIENLSSSQKELLCNLVQEDERGKTVEPGYVNVLTGNNEVKAPRFGSKPPLIRDFEALCDVGLLILEQRYPTRKYRIKNVAFALAKSLTSEKRVEKDKGEKVIETSVHKSDESQSLLNGTRSPLTSGERIERTDSQEQSSVNHLSEIQDELKRLSFGRAADEVDWAALEHCYAGGEVKDKIAGSKEMFLAEQLFEDKLRITDSAIDKTSNFFNEENSLVDKMTDWNSLTTNARPLENTFDIFPSIDRNHSYNSPPNGGSLCLNFQVTKGKCEQVGNVFDEEFCREKRPLCYLDRHEGSFYWHIEIYQGNEDEAIKLLKTLASREKEDVLKAFDACMKWNENTLRIGYVQISDRPLVPVRFFVFKEEHENHVKTISGQVIDELKKWNFEFDTQYAAETEQQKSLGEDIANGKDPDGKKVILQTRPPGRKLDADYNEAFDRICQGQKESTVFGWYCEKKGWSNPGKSERDAFKAAMKRRRKGTK